MTWKDEIKKNKSPYYKKLDLPMVRKRLEKAKRELDEMIKIANSDGGDYLLLDDLAQNVSGIMSLFAYNREGLEELYPETKYYEESRGMPFGY
jgi:hypothetical protein